MPVYFYSVVDWQFNLLSEMFIIELRFSCSYS